MRRTSVVRSSILPSQRGYNARSSYELLEFAQRLAGVGAWEVTLPEMGLFWSKQVFEIHEFDTFVEPPVEDAINFYALEHRETVQQKLQEAMDGKIFDFELELITAKGNRRWVRSMGGPIYENGELVKIAGAFQDIHDRKVREAYITELEGRARLAIDSAQLGMWDWKPENNTVSFNEYWYSILGYEPYEMPETFETFASLLHPEDLDRVQNTLQAYFRQEIDEYSLAIRLRTKSGDYHWVRTVGAITERDEDGTPLRIVGCHFDLHKERKRAENLERANKALIESQGRIEAQAVKLHEAQRRAEASKEAKANFLANMSHEIRTPMNAILGMTDLLLESGLDADQTELATTVQDAGNSLLRIINDILDFSKIDSGKLSIRRDARRLGELVDAIEKLFKLRVRERSLNFKVLIDESIRTQVYLLDEVRMRQVLLNLISNAVKFTPAGGEVTLSVTVIDADSSKDKLLFSVKDTGIGISPEKVDAIFAPFEQVENDVSRGFEGTGLGLSITSSLVALMGGSISVESSEGVGSEFRFEVTFEKGESRALSEDSLGFSEKDLARELRGMRILVAEDNPVNQKLVMRLLERMGCAVTLANNGEEAVAAANQEPFEVILMDIQMPSVSGIEAMQRLKAQDYQAPIVALTAHALVEEKERCMQAGMDGYITKPIDRTVLYETLWDVRQQSNSKRS